MCNCRYAQVTPKLCETGLENALNLYRNIKTQLELDREYSPSSCIDNLPGRLDEYVRRSVQARASARQMKTFRYGESSSEEMDVFLSGAQQLTGQAPTLIYIHGGYWQESSKDDYSFLAEELSKQGVNLITLGYGLAPASTIGEMTRRCREAMLWIAQHAEDLGLDVDNVHLAGSSAGAHLAAMTALTLPINAALEIQTLLLLSGVFDLRPITLTYVNAPLAMSFADALQNSPLLLVDAAQTRLPRTVVAYGSNETSEFKRQSVEMAEALQRRGGDVTKIEVAGRDHFDLIYDLANDSSTLRRAASITSARSSMKD